MDLIDAAIMTIWLFFVAAFLASYIMMCVENIGGFWGVVFAMSPILSLVFCFFYYGGVQ